MVKVGFTFDRITVNEKMFAGQPCIRGMRIPVSVVVKRVASGMSHKEILDEYPELEEEDIKQSLEFAAFLATEKSIPLNVSSK